MFNKEVEKLKLSLLKTHGISLSINKNVIESLSKKAHAEKMGARPIRKLMQQKIENIISKTIIGNNSKKIHIKKSDLT